MLRQVNDMLGLMLSETMDWTVHTWRTPNLHVDWTSRLVLPKLTELTGSGDSLALPFQMVAHFFCYLTSLSRSHTFLLSSICVGVRSSSINDLDPFSYLLSLPFSNSFVACIDRFRFWLWQHWLGQCCNKVTLM
jgi:hypothetical protein